MTLSATQITRLLAQRTQHVKLGWQSSVAVPGLINMGSGTPDFEPPKAIFDAMHEAIDARHIRYTPWAGIPALREAAATKLARENNLTIDPEREVIMTAGAQEAVVAVLMALLDSGDNVLMPSPHYSVYSDCADMLGASVIPVMTKREDNFLIDVNALEAAITPRTKAIILVTPSNPTGTVTPESTLKAVADLAIKHDLIVVADEIYEHYVFDGHKHISLATLPGMRERTISLYSLSKGYALTGLRVGYIVAQPDLLQAIMPFHHAMMICASSVAQYGAVAALSMNRDWFEPHLAEYDRRRKLWMSTLDNLGIPYGEPQGAYYVCIDVSPTGHDAKTVSQRLREDVKVVINPAGQHFLRASLMQASPQFEEGLERVTTCFKAL
ncbi:MAG: pyridoxal phosphate-dependent aminotransferase [Deinococcota bacterium]